MNSKYRYFPTLKSPNSKSKEKTLESSSIPKQEIPCEPRSQKRKKASKVLILELSLLCPTVASPQIHHQPCHSHGKKKKQGSISHTRQYHVNDVFVAVVLPLC